MKIFVTGVGGQLGHDVMNELAARGHEGIGSDVAESYAGIQDHTDVCTMPYVRLDITDRDTVSRVLEEVNPDAVIHCAAWTAVDAAEDEDKKETVRRINADGTHYIAEACRRLDCRVAIRLYFLSLYNGDIDAQTVEIKYQPQLFPFNILTQVSVLIVEKCRFFLFKQLTFLTPIILFSPSY